MPPAGDQPFSIKAFGGNTLDSDSDTQCTKTNLNNETPPYFGGLDLPKIILKLSISYLTIDLREGQGLHRKGAIRGTGHTQE